MTDLDFRKQILASNIKKSKAYVGASLVEALDENRESDYIYLLNEVMESLDNAINLLDPKKGEGE